MERVKRHVVAIDIGGTKTAVAIGTCDGKMLARYQERTASDPNVGIDWITRVMKDWLRQSNNQINSIVSAGVGCPGPLDRKKGIILKAPNLKTWNGFPLGETLAAKLNVAVHLENDANLAAVGEHRFGAGCGHNDLVYVTVSTGIGGGLIIHNQLVHGVNDSAGEIGHMTIHRDGPLCNCGNYGCLEAMASGTAVVRNAVELILEGKIETRLSVYFNHLEDLTAEIIADVAAEGDAAATSIIEEAMVNLSIGLGNIMTTLSPEIIVVGGGLSNLGDRMFTIIEKEVRKRVRQVPAEQIPIVPAKLKGDSVLFGGFYLAEHGSC